MSQPRGGSNAGPGPMPRLSAGRRRGGVRRDELLAVVNPHEARALRALLAAWARAERRKVEAVTAVLFEQRTVRCAAAGAGVHPKQAARWTAGFVRTLRRAVEQGLIDRADLGGSGRADAGGGGA